MVDQNAYQTRIIKLTGEPWCPYPSELFMLAVLKADDDTAKRIIEERQRFLFPIFLTGEPQQKELERIMEK